MSYAKYYWTSNSNSILGSLILAVYVCVSLTQVVRAEPELPSCMKTEYYFPLLSDQMRRGLTGVQRRHYAQLISHKVGFDTFRPTELRVLSWLRHLDRISIIFPRKCGVACRGSLMIAPKKSSKLLQILASDTGAAIINLRMLDEFGVPFGAYGGHDAQAEERVRSHNIIMFLARPDSRTAYKIEQEVLTKSFYTLQTLPQIDRLSEVPNAVTDVLRERRQFQDGRFSVEVADISDRKLLESTFMRPCHPFE